MNLAGKVNRLFKAILPDEGAWKYAPQAQVIRTLARKIQSLRPEVDISHVTGQIEAVLDDSIKAKDYVIHESDGLYDLSKIDFEALKERFQQGRKRTETEKLRGTVHAKIQRMINRNPPPDGFPRRVPPDDRRIQQRLPQRGGTLR